MRLGFMKKGVGIDLGTANTLVCVKGEGVVVRESSVVAVNRDGRVVACGDEAKAMIGRTPGNIRAVRPLKDGVIADFDNAMAMLSAFMKKALPNQLLYSPHVVIGVPSEVTEVEKRAVEDAAYNAGARKVMIIEEPMAAAIGAGLPIVEPIGSMVVDIGGGTTEIAVISLAGIVVSKSLRVAGDDIDEAIIQFVRKKFSLTIGHKTAENLKMEIGCAKVSEKKKEFKITGRNLVTGLPNTIVLTSHEVHDAIKDTLYLIVDGVKNILERTLPELAADVMESGIMLTGGGALIEGFDKVISEETGMPVHVADNPLDCVANGTVRVVESFEMYDRALNGK